MASSRSDTCPSTFSIAGRDSGVTRAVSGASRPTNHMTLDAPPTTDDPRLHRRTDVTWVASSVRGIPAHPVPCRPPLSSAAGRTSGPPLPNLEHSLTRSWLRDVGRVVTVESADAAYASRRRTQHTQGRVDMADFPSLPGPDARQWNWQLDGLCRTLSPEVFFHPEGERGTARRTRAENAKSVCLGCPVPVSYTHLDVYKRQPRRRPEPRGRGR